MESMFSDRIDAGARLAKELSFLSDTNCVVIGLPRGGVPVAFEVAKALGAPLDVVVVRKLGFPENPEVAAGAIAENGSRIVDNDLVSRSGANEQELQHVEEREQEAVKARVARLRHGRERIDLHNRTVLVVDDGIATGATARVACQAVRQQGASRVILAVPVAPPEVVHNFPDADTVICLSEPPDFWAVGQFYVDFSETTDDEVSELLDRARFSQPT